MESLMLIRAAVYAAEKHKYQRRKGFNQVPYINHPLKVAELLVQCGERDNDLIIASLLHDIIEDTDSNAEEIATLFNENISSIVLEVTDDKDLPYAVRKELQVKAAPNLSKNAQLIKIADKICNIRDILSYPVDWSPERKLSYLDWAVQVAAGCRGNNAELDQIFDRVVSEGQEQLKDDL